MTALVVVVAGVLSAGRVGAQDADDLESRIREVEPRVLDVTPRILEVEPRIVDIVVPSGPNTEIPIAADVLFAFGSAELTTEAFESSSPGWSTGFAPPRHRVW